MHNQLNIDLTRPIDLISMGRVAVDLYAEQIGSPLRDVDTFRKYLGGCAGNIAVGSARLGLNTFMFSCVGADEMGQFIKQTLQAEGIDISLLKESKQHLTGLVLLGIIPPDHFPLMFYRNQCADMQLQAIDLPASIMQQAKTILITGTGISTHSMRKTTYDVITMAKSVATQIILDLDYRPVLWNLTDQGDGETRYIPSEEVSRHYYDLLAYCDLIVGTEQEIQIAGQCDVLADAIHNIHMTTKAPVIMKRGEHGCTVFFSDSTRFIHSPGFPVKVLNVLGAGDAFLSGLLRGLLHGETWEKSMQYANACGAIVVTRHGCAPSMPYFTEVMKFIKQREQQCQTTT